MRESPRCYPDCKSRTAGGIDAVPVCGYENHFSRKIPDKGQDLFRDEAAADDGHARKLPESFGKPGAPDGQDIEGRKNGLPAPEIALDVGKHRTAGAAEKIRQDFRVIRVYRSSCHQGFSVPAEKFPEFCCKRSTGKNIREVAPFSEPRNFPVGREAFQCGEGILIFLRTPNIPVKRFPEFNVQVQRNSGECGFGKSGKNFPAGGGSQGGVGKHRHMHESGIAAVEPILFTGLVGSGFQKLPRPVGSYQDQGNMTVSGLHNRRQKVPGGSSGGGDYRHRFSVSQCHSQCQKAQISFIEMHVPAQRWKAFPKEGKGSIPGSRSNADILHITVGKQGKNAEGGKNAVRHGNNLVFSRRRIRTGVRQSAPGDPSEDRERSGLPAF